MKVESKPWAIVKHNGISLGKTPRGPVDGAKRHRFAFLRPGQKSPLVVSAAVESNPLKLCVAGALAVLSSLVPLVARGITVAYHSGDSGYLKFHEAWGLGGEFKAFDFDPMRLCMSASPVSDLLAALFCGGLFDRHRNLRVATIETGSSWVPGLLMRFKKAYGQMPFAFGQDPVEAFRRHVWVSPYYEDPLLQLRDTIGADHMLFGSDFPHGEGLAEPTDFLHDLDGFGKDDVRLIMRENGLSLAKPRPA